MPSTRWIYTPEGKPVFYHEREFIYSTTGQATYLVRDGWWYEVKGGAAKYWTKDKWIYTVQGKAMFFYD
jgi:hypothetical protein